MQYLGGKHRLAPHLTRVIRREVGDAAIWEPFCGGGAMTAELARTGAPGIASDIHAPLISLHRAVQAGWMPPAVISEAEWRAARSLPDSDPLKAFCGYGVSYGGKWFAGYVAPGPLHPRGLACGAANSLARKHCATRAWTFRHLSFFAIRPGPLAGAIYCDPPYAGTTSYGAVEPLDHDRFWTRCLEWSRHTRVFVSELQCPLPPAHYRVLWYVTRTRAVSGKTGRVTECLFEVLR